MSTPAAPSDPSPRTAVGPTGPFGYTDEGQGPLVVAVHGLPGSTRDYRWLGAALEGHARFIRLDMPGFWGTPLSSGAGVEIDARGAFVAGALAALGVERALLVGHSMGGAVALSAAVQAPERVRALGLLSSIGLRPHVLLRRFVGRRAFARAIDLPGLKAPTRALLKAAMQSVGFPSSVTRDEIAQTIRCVAAVEFDTQRRNTGRLTIPTLTAWAEDDAFIETAVMQEHAAALPPGPRLSWPAGGHNIQKSRAVELAEALLGLARGIAT